MKLWLREFATAAENLQFDSQVEVRSQEEWLELVNRPGIVSSILWPEPPLFFLQGPDYHGRRHPHERGYRNFPPRNLSYRQGCRRLAERLSPLVDKKRCLVYAPLRGALPIWNGIRRFLTAGRCETYHAVTSSFVFYPEAFRIRNRKGRPASGRFTHRLELRTRIEPWLDRYDLLVYVDEIVSGGMMKAHLKDMFELGIDRRVPIVAVGLADRFGERSLPNRQIIEGFREQGRISEFLWEGCGSLITEDHRYLLGVHYVDYRLGPHAVPMLVESEGTGPGFAPEKAAFDREVTGREEG